MFVKKVILVLFLFSFILTAEEYKKASDFKLKDIKGKTVKLKDALEKGPVLIDFWASWCVPCKEEMPIFNDLYGKYKEKGLSVFLITIDKGSAIQKAKSFVKSKGFDFTVLMVTDVVRGSSRIMMENTPAILEDLPFLKNNDGTLIAKDMVSRKKQLVPVILSLLEG